MSNFLIHNCILFTLLSLFFIFYVSDLTSNIFSHEITKLIDPCMHSLKDLNINFKKIIDLYLTSDFLIKKSVLVGK